MDLYTSTTKVWCAWVSSTSDYLEWDPGTSDKTWSYWIEPDSGTSYTTNNYTTDSVWSTWVLDGHTLIIQGAAIPPQTPEQKAENDRIYAEAQKAAEESMKRAQEERERAEARKKVAEEKALDLLMSLLDEGQQAMLKKDGHFVVFGEKTGNKYRIKKGLAGNIELLGNNDRVLERWCWHIPYGYPDYDNMVAQKLMLEADEEQAMAQANKTRMN